MADISSAIFYEAVQIADYSYYWDTKYNRDNLLYFYHAYTYVH